MGKKVANPNFYKNYKERLYMNALDLSKTMNKTQDENVIKICEHEGFCKCESSPNQENLT